MSTPFYESDRALAEYLLFHYGPVSEGLPPEISSVLAGNFPARCVDDCLDVSKLPANAKALDLGCAVGRAAFELARHCAHVTGIDYSERFVTIAEHLRQNGSLLFGRLEEGELTEPCQAIVPEEIDRSRVRFLRGDAMDLPEGLGQFDVVLMANLIDRLREPMKCLDALPKLVNRGGQLIITSPYTWLAEYTPRSNWLGGFERDGRRVRTREVLKEILAPQFEFVAGREIPFVIREHARKFQLGFADAAIWRKR